MKAKILTLIALIGILASCATKQATVKAGLSEADVNRVKSFFPDYSLSELQKGESLYKANCGACHSLKDPSAESEATWKGIVPPMVKKANKKNGTALSAQDEQAILRYVLTMGPYNIK